MTHDLEQKIEDFTEEMFADLGLIALSEEQKADIFARAEEHLHRAILDTLRYNLKADEAAKLEQALSQENYEALGRVLKRHPQYKTRLNEQIEKEFNQLKLTIAGEQAHAREKTDEPQSGEGGVAAGAAP